MMIKEGKIRINKSIKEVMAMKSKFLLSLTVILVATALMAGATLALFTSEATVEGNTLGAGSLELTIDNPEAKIFAIDNIYPGKEFAMMDVDIHNSGSLPYYLKAVITETGSENDPGGGYLAEVVNVSAALTGSSGITEYNSTLENVLENDLVWKNSSEYLIIEPGQTVSFQLFGQLDLTAGNEYQESIWEGLITFSAVQSDGQAPGADFSWGDAAPFEPGDPGFTVEAWLKWNVEPELPEPVPAEMIDQRWATIVADGSADTGLRQTRYHLQHNQRNTAFEIAMRADNRVFISSKTAPEKDKWYHLVGVYDQDEQQLKIFVI
jgi:predicted ribosomally synthesized peptide with SipW-like signal peptide